MKTIGHLGRVRRKTPEKDQAWQYARNPRNTYTIPLTDLGGNQQRWFPLSTPDGSYGARFPLRAGACPDGLSFSGCISRCFLFGFGGITPKYWFVCAKPKGNERKSAIDSRSVTKIGMRVDQFFIDFCAKF